MEIAKTLPIILSYVTTVRRFTGRIFSVIDVLTIVICGTLCGLKDLKQIHTYAHSEGASKMFKEVFNIERCPSYSQMTRIMAIIDTNSLNDVFICWSKSLAKKLEIETEQIVSIDGKTIRSTGKMAAYDKALHIVSAIAARSGITLGQLAVDGKSNEIPAGRDLIRMLNLSECIVVADAMHCQKETCEDVVSAGANYVLPVKENQKNLLNNIKDLIEPDVNIESDYKKTFEQNRDRMEQREAYVLNDVSGIIQKDEWKNLAAIGMIRSTRYKDEKFSTETRYYICSKTLMAEELIEITRKEWSIETMHWHLDVNFKEDFCRLQDINSQKNLNIVRKTALNRMKQYKRDNKDNTPISQIMLSCLLNCKYLLNLLRKIVCA